MATTTGNTGWLATSNSAITQQLKWEITPGTASSNKSKVKLTYYLKKNPAIQNTPTESTQSRFTFSVTGKTSVSIGPVSRYISATNTAIEVASATFNDVAHKADGTMSATFAMNGGLAGTSISSLSVSRTVTFPTIARASSITSVTDTIIGNAPTATWTPLSAGFYYNLKYSIGTWEHTIEGLHPDQTTAYSYSLYSLPLDMAAEITQSTIGTATATLYTYSDSECTKLVGAAQTKTFTVTVPDSLAPVMASLDAVAVNENATVAGWQINLEGFTYFRIEAEGTPYQDTSIASFSMDGAYAGTILDVVDNEATYNGPVITGSGTKVFTVIATDVRGMNSPPMSVSRVVYPYYAPTISAFFVARNANQGGKLDMRVDCSYASCHGNNSATATLYYKKSTEAAFTTFGTVAVNQDITVNTNLSEEYRYDVRVIVEDALGYYAVANAELPTATVLLDFRAGGRGLGIGKIAEADRLEIGLDTNFFGDVYIDSVPLDAYLSSQTGVASIVDYYATSETTVCPDLQDFDTEVPVITAQDKYLWNYQVITYNDGNSFTSDPVIIGAYGDTGPSGGTGATGAAGVGIRSVTEYYETNNTPSTPPAWEDFDTSIKSPTNSNRYLWNYELITYTDNSTERTSRHVVGVYGGDGSTGRGISSIDEHYQISDNSTIPPSTWEDAPPVLTSTLKYLWNYETINYTSGSPASEDTDKRVIGVYGDTGEDGEDGYSVVLESSAGEIFKNSTGITTLTLRVYQGGVELDTTGVAFNYSWTKYDKNGNVVPSFSATTKSITVTADDINEKAVYKGDVSW